MGRIAYLSAPGPQAAEHGVHDGPGAVVFFLAVLDPLVWGTETLMTAEASPLPTPPVRSDEGELPQFTWITTTPELHRSAPS
ncbi:hypothetical protein [Streptomyces sp. 142MFCol3.1]|uniref:hypothetical protein n=1 Tax=Streptomyces sp. 142MFCol3.1 TaxID=1172179 RepID=UPI0003FD8CF7|nr:hypothetical protein [Streptomyces sp. 142MFCol3.1]